MENSGENPSSVIGIVDETDETREACKVCESSTGYYYLFATSLPSSVIYEIVQEFKSRTSFMRNTDRCEFCKTTHYSIVEVIALDT